ncbi:hypothetical protein NEOKW01_0330 [Nematocida sp. AWRm80]|nr:hypothetical protein NEOKW01_0330 [Nematocida sp. AWRm80]
MWETEFKKYIAIKVLNYNHNPNLIKNIIKLKNKKIIKLNKSTKRIICTCNAIRIPTVNTTSRIIKKEDGEYILSHCLECSSTKQMRILCNYNRNTTK